MRTVTSVALSVAGLSLFFCTWALVAWATAVPDTILPAPGAVIKRAIDLLGDPMFQKSGKATLARWAIGFVSGTVVGFIMGILVGSWSFTRHLFLPLLDFLRSIPVTIAFPAFLLAFGLTDTTNVAMAFAGTVFLVALNVAVGVDQASPARKAFFRLHRARWSHRVIYLYVPESIPNLVIALRATVSLSLIVVLVSEMFIGANAGLGQMAYDSYLQNAPTTLFAIIIWVGVAGFAANQLFAQVPSVFSRFYAWS